MSRPHYSKGVGIALLTIVVAVVFMIVYEIRIADTLPGPYIEGGKLSDTQKESLKWMLDLVKLLISWSVAIIGAAGFFLKFNADNNMPLHFLDIYLSFSIIVLAVISLFFGHLSMDKSSELLSLDLYPVNDEVFRSLVRHQYLTILGATGLFGLHVFQFFLARTSIDKRESNEKC